MVLMVLMSVIITGYIMVLAWAGGVQSQITSNLVKVDANYYAAEAGAQRAAWYIKNNTTVGQPLTGTINGSSYSVTWVGGSGSSQRVTSVATKGNARSTVLVTVTPPASAPATAISISTNLNLKNLSITGNVIVGQIMTFAPGNAQIDGNLTYGTSYSGSPSVSGTMTKAAWQGINWANVQTTLQTAAGKTYNGAQSNTTFDFTTVSGTNKVIYVNGNVTNPNFVGSGTLYVNGVVTFGGGVGSPTAPVNVVATGDVTTSNNSSYYGSIYTKGNWNRGKIAVTGSLYVEGMDQSNNGSSSIKFTSTPWFDNRGAGGGLSGGGSVTQYANFAGAGP